MKLVITTPVQVAVEAEGLLSLRAEDASGWFGIRPGHADFMTVLCPSVVSWLDADGIERFCAVLGGVLTVRNGAEVEIATRQAFAGDDLDSLGGELAAAQVAAAEASALARTDTVGLEAAALRHLQTYLQGRP